MRTESEMTAALRAHQKKYPLKLGGMPIKDWFESEAEREEEEQDEGQLSPKADVQASSKSQIL